MFSGIESRGGVKHGGLVYSLYFIILVVFGNCIFCRVIAAIHHIPGAQKHLIHISSTKGLTHGMGRSLAQDPKKAFLKFRKWGLDTRWRHPMCQKIDFFHTSEYIHQTFAKMFSLGVLLRIHNS